MDAFTQKRLELMIDLATKKLAQEINSLKESVASLGREIAALKSRTSNTSNSTNNNDAREVKKEIKIIDCRPENERKEEFQSGAAKNTEAVMPRYGNYEPKDVSIDKFFYFGRK